MATRNLTLRLLVVAASVLAVAGPALAQTADPVVEAARATGKVGEQSDGYLGIGCRVMAILPNGLRRSISSAAPSTPTPQRQKPASPLSMSAPRRPASCSRHACQPGNITAPRVATGASAIPANQSPYPAIAATDIGSAVLWNRLTDQPRRIMLIGFRTCALRF